VKLVKKIAFILTAVVLLAGADRGAAEPSKIRCAVGYSLKTIADIDPRDAAAALRVWAREMGNPYGFQVETFLYESVDKLISDFSQQKLDFVMIHTVDYLRAASSIKVKPEMARVKNNKTTIKYVLLSGAAAAPGDFPRLKSKNLSIAKANSLGLIYLDVCLMQAGFPDSERFFNAIQYKSRESQAILAVFFGQADACLVTETAFNTMKELNPQVGQKLRVMAESPEMVEAVGFFRNNYPQNHKEIAIKGMHGGIKSHERGKQVLLMFNVEQMDPIGDADIDSVRKLLAGYDRFKKRK